MAIRVTEIPDSRGREVRRGGCYAVAKSGGHGRGFLGWQGAPGLFISKEVTYAVVLVVLGVSRWARPGGVGAFLALQRGGPHGPRVEWLRGSSESPWP